MAEFDLQFKIVLVGDEKCGKSSLLARYVCDSFTGTYSPTSGTDFKARTIEIEGATCKIEVWDTAGHEGLLTSFSRFFRNSQGVLICYDVCNRASFESLPKYLQQVQMNAPVDAAIFIVGCKSDCIFSRKVAAAEGEKFAASKRCPFFEVSAKVAGDQVQSLFTAAAAQLLKQHAQQRHTGSGGVGGVIGSGGGGGLEGDASLSLLREGEGYGDEEVQGEEALRSTFSRSTLTEGAAGAGSRLLQSAYPLYISGAQSWYNSAKINGRYVPRLSRLRRNDAVQVFSYWSLDSANTVMLFKDNHWVVKRNRKELARLPSPSIDCFPDAANKKAPWRENTGVYFTWLHLRPEIRCVALSASPAAALPTPSSGPFAAANSSIGGGGSPGEGGGPAEGESGGWSGRSGGGNSNRRQSASFSEQQQPYGGIFGMRTSFSERERASFSGFSEHGTAGSSNRVYRGPGNNSGALLSASGGSCSNLAQKGLMSQQVGTGIFASILVIPLLNSGGGGGGGGDVIIINMDAFYRCSRDPQRLLGLTPLLFAQYCELRLAVLEYEYKAAPGILDSATLVKICANTRRIQEACADMLVTAGQVPHSAAPSVEATAEGVQAAGRALLRGLSKQLATLCDVSVSSRDAGNVEQAGRCRDVKVEVEGYLDEMRGGLPTGRGSFSLSMGLSGRASFSSSTSGRW